MRCFSFSKGTLTDGIELVTHVDMGPVIELGDRGRGRWLERVKLDARRPPTIATIDEDAGKSLVSNAGLIRFSVKGELPPTVLGRNETINYRHALVAPLPGEEFKALVRVRTLGIFQRNSFGVVRHYWGNPQEGAKGQGAFVDRGGGSLGTWEDSLWVLQEGDALWVKITGKETYIVEWWRQKLCSYTVDAWLNETLYKEKVQLWEEEVYQRHLLLAQNRHHQKLVDHLQEMRLGTVTRL